jgi:hypothetical protein
MPEPWAPSLDDVARHIPRRTRDATVPGSDRMLGTFTANTTPTDAQANAVIDEVVAGIVAAYGPVPASPPASDQITVAARSAAAWRAAADIEIAYPNRDADVAVYAELDRRASAALATYLSVLEAAGSGTVDVLPSWAAPDPVTIAPWGDVNI